MGDQPKTKCMRCGHHAGEQFLDGQICRFARRVDTGRFDSLCVRCRFAVIDAAAADLDGIRDDMESAGIPVTKRKRR